MIDKWLGTRKKDERYGWDDTTYIHAANFLDFGPVEDWGCGGSYARKFFKNQYIGVDGTNDFCDICADLRTYKSNTYGILLRHVLEHNLEWRPILENALVSCERLALVIFTPFGDETKQIAWNEPWGVPDMSFKKSDITDYFSKYEWSEETIDKAGSVYNAETIFYVTIPRKELLCRELLLS